MPLAELRSMIYAFPTFYGGIGQMVGSYDRGLPAVIDPGSHGFDPHSMKRVRLKGPDLDL